MEIKRIDKDALDYILRRWDEAVSSQTRKGNRSIPNFVEEIEIIANIYDEYLAQRTNNTEDGK